jgi:hypothetical protein
MCVYKGKSGTLLLNGAERWLGSWLKYQVNVFSLLKRISTRSTTIKTVVYTPVY